MTEEPILVRFSDFHFDLVALVICFCYFIILWITGPPMHHDTQYHLAVARMFYQNGSITLWDSLQYQPVGRPHLYPPLVHILLWFLIVLFNEDILLVAKIAISTIWPMLLLSVWFLARQLKGSRTGLFSLIAASSIIGMFNLSSFIMPTTICLIFLNILLWSVIRQKDDKRYLLLSTFLLALICWSHLSFLLVPIISLTSYSIQRWYATKDRDYLLNLLVNVVGALIFYSPWLIHVLLNLSWLGTSGNISEIIVDIAIPIFPVLLAIPAFYRLIKSWDTSDFIFISPLIGMLVMIPYAHRFWPYFTFYLSFLVGMTVTDIKSLTKSLQRSIEASLENLTDFFRPVMKVLPTIVLLLLIVPSFTFYPAVKSGFVLGAPFYPYIPTSSFITPTPAIVVLDWVVVGRDFQLLEPGLIEVSTWIIDHLSRDELIHLVGPNTGAMFACGLILLTGNPVTNGQWSETVPEKVIIRIENYMRTAPGYFLCRGADNVPLGAVIRATFSDELVMAYRP
ncbi:MAG: hypothetical protein ACFFBD_18955 [Candidatus Hodarchaeota archaeon]